MSLLISSAFELPGARDQFGATLDMPDGTSAQAVAASLAMVQAATLDTRQTEAPPQPITPNKFLLSFIGCLIVMLIALCVYRVYR